MRKSKVLTLSIPPKMLKEIERLSYEQAMTKSELLREALRSYIWEREWRKLRILGKKKVVKYGIKSEEDVYKILGNA